MPKKGRRLKLGLKKSLLAVLQKSEASNQNEQYRIALLSPDGTGQSVLAQTVQRRWQGAARSRDEQASRWQKGKPDMIGNQSQLSTCGIYLIRYSEI